jgi:hypothetical protein
MKVKNDGGNEMDIKFEAKRILEMHRNGQLSKNQFLHQLNRLITVRREEPTVIAEIESGRWLIESTDARMIPTILDSDSEINARAKDVNGFSSKVRAVVTNSELLEILEALEVGLE